MWRWRAWDHLVQDFDAGLPDHGVVSDHPELLDINFFQGPPNSADWIHLNGVTYNPELDQILLSAHSFDEIWIIDHSTTTAEAATHAGGQSGRGGDLLYRWENPRAYGRGGMSDQRLFGQHNATWLPEGHAHAGSILVFNNGNGRPGGNFSSVDLIDPPLGSGGTYTLVPGEAFGPSEATELYTDTPPSNFYSMAIGGVAPIGQGYLVSDGMGGRFFEVDADEHIVWEYINPANQTGPLEQGMAPDNNQVFRCAYYSPDFAGFTGQTLVPGDEIELEPLEPSLCATTDVISPKPVTLMQAHPNPATETIVLDPVPAGSTCVRVVDGLGRTLSSVPVDRTGRCSIDLKTMPSGLVVLDPVDRNGKSLGRVRAVKL